MNPLPFQDLEPKRFEDLVRQLAYDFKPWRRLEATGRAGSDDGFDARGLEIVPSPEATASSDDGTEEEGEGADDRLWLVQCKREKQIAAAKLLRYLEDIPPEDRAALHGIVLAAACDFSKRTRDAFFAWCREHGIAEAHLWGKGELEDQLFQPKNDHLLFAYFGVSLTIRRRSLATQLRALLTTKRKLAKTVGISSADVLLRDPAAANYPYTDPGERPTRWQVYSPEKLSHAGQEFSIRWHHAFVDFQTGQWDAATATSFERRHHAWRVDDEEHDRLAAEASVIWDDLPQENKGWLQVTGVVDLKDVVAVDELGDDVFSGVHIYVPFTEARGPFAWFYMRLTGTSRHSGELQVDDSKRIQRFPDHLRAEWKL